MYVPAKLNFTPISTKLMKVGLILNYPLKNAAGILPKNRGTNKFSFGVQTFFEKTKTIKNIKGSPYDYFEPKEGGYSDFLTCC